MDYYKFDITSESNYNTLLDINTDLNIAGFTIN